MSMADQFYLFLRDEVLANNKIVLNSWKNTFFFLLKLVKFKTSLKIALNTFMFVHSVIRFIPHITVSKAPDHVGYICYTTAKYIIKFVPQTVVSSNLL